MSREESYWLVAEEGASNNKVDLIIKGNCLQEVDQNSCQVLKNLSGHSVIVDDEEPYFGAYVSNENYFARAAFWAYWGLNVGRKDKEYDYTVSFESPLFMDMKARFPTLLPGGRVVFQMGHNILLLDIDKRNLYQITQGTSPVVIMENKPRK